MRPPANAPLILQSHNSKCWVTFNYPPTRPVREEDKHLCDRRQAAEATSELIPQPAWMQPEGPNSWGQSQAQAPPAQTVLLAPARALVNEVMSPVSCHSRGCLLPRVDSALIRPPALPTMGASVTCDLGAATSSDKHDVPTLGSQFPDGQGILASGADPCLSLRSVRKLRKALSTLRRKAPLLLRISGNASWLWNASKKPD